MTQENHVSALLAAENETARAHGFEHVAVAHAGADHFAASLFDGFIEPEIAHHGGNHGASGQFVAAQQVEAGHGEQFVAIERVAGFVAQQKAVGVAVMGEPDLRSGFLDQPADFPGYGATATIVDILSVGRRMKNLRIGAESAEG